MKVETEVWCVKYALTQGVFKINGFINEHGRFRCPFMYHQHFLTHLSPKEFDLTLEGAMLKSEAMRKKKIASLRKQIAKLESLEIKLL